MKAGPKTYLLWGFIGLFIFLMNLAELLSGQGDLIDVLETVVFAILSAEGFVSYLRMKGKTQFHFLS
jgi:hypothetical protein